MRTSEAKSDRTGTPRRPDRETPEAPAGESAIADIAEAREASSVEETSDSAERPNVPSQSTLAQLMRKAIAGRRRMIEAQDKLREMELELRHGDSEVKSRFERLRASALDEYRSARAEAERARRQLASSLRLLPGRHESRARGAEAA